MNYFLDIVVHQNLEFISDENLRNGWVFLQAG